MPVRRKFGAKLIGNLFRDLALDGKHVGEITIIGLGSKMRIGAGVVLHAGRKVSVLFVITQVFERQDRDAFSGAAVA